MNATALIAFVLGCLLPAGCERPAAARQERLPGADALAATGAMAQARAAHTATLLPDGHVLVAGGFTDQENAPAGAELFDPRAGTFAPAAPMQTPRHSHTATRLPDGRVLIAGGYDARGTYLDSAELFDPATGTFSVTGAMHGARAGHVAVLLSDGRVLVAGGVGTGWTFLPGAELYDPATGTFAPTGSMTVPRESHAAVRLPDGRVLVAGGHRGRGADITLYASAEVYDPATGTFTPAGNMTVRRHKHDALLLADGDVLITGGTDERDSRGVYRSTERYHPQTGVFRADAPLRQPRYKHQGTSLLLPDGRVLLAGGAETAEVYDAQTGAFAAVAGDARLAGQFSATALLPDGRVLITGGYGHDRGPQRSAWLYRP